MFWANLIRPYCERNNGCSNTCIDNFLKMFSIQPLCKRSQKGQSNYKFDMMMTIIYCFTCQKINLFYLLTETLNELPVAHVHMFYISQVYHLFGFMFIFGYNTAGR